MADQLKLGSDETEKKNFRSSKRSIDVNNVNIEKNIRIYWIYLWRKQKLGCKILHKI